MTAVQRRNPRCQDFGHGNNFSMTYSGFTQFRGVLIHKCPDVTYLQKFALGMALCNWPTGVTRNTIFYFIIQLAEYATYMPGFLALAPTTCEQSQNSPG